VGNEQVPDFCYHPHDVRRRRARFLFSRRKECFAECLGAYCRIFSLHAISAGSKEMVDEEVLAQKLTYVNR